MHTARHQRIAEQIQKELAQLIPSEVQDPRIGMVTITSVDLGPDYSLARIFFTKLGGEGASESTSEALNHAAGFLRAQLARRLSTRFVPRLEFIYDVSVERGVRLSKLIDQALSSNSDINLSKN